MNIKTDIQNLKDRLQSSDRMPVLFLGHGSPMNAIEKNSYSQTWMELGHALPHPQAILVISAHWMTYGKILADISSTPRIIHDFHGFPQQLYNQQYPAKGHPEIASNVATMLAAHHAEKDETWGLDHGAWAVLKWLYPDANIPVFQLSIDMNAPLESHIEVGQILSSLRDKGVLILGSGNIVHNLSAINTNGKKYDWAEQFDSHFADLLEMRNFKALADANEWGNILEKAHPSLDHYIPALTIAGASNKKDDLLFANENIDMASISMRSFIFY